MRGCSRSEEKGRESEVCIKEREGTYSIAENNESVMIVPAVSVPASPEEGHRWATEEGGVPVDLFDALGSRIYQECRGYCIGR